MTILSDKIKFSLAFDGKYFLFDVGFQGRIIVDDQQMFGLWVVLFTAWFLAATHLWVTVHSRLFTTR